MNAAQPLDPPPVPAQGLPLTRLLPNILTLMSLSSGLMAIRHALNGKWEAAVVAIVIAAIFDMLDGRVARMLNMSSKFGAELDSLSDNISFGVAPGFMLYLWTLHDGGSLGWIAVLGYVLCTTLRLARFNTMLEDLSIPAWKKKFFTGVPAPAGAGLVILPMILSFELGDEILRTPKAMAIWAILIGLMMVSRLPTLSFKSVRVPRLMIAPFLVVVGLVAAAVVTNPWVTLGIIGVAYIMSLPVSWVTFWKNKKAYQERDPS